MSTLSRPKVRWLKITEIHDLARQLEWFVLRSLAPQHRKSAIRYTHRGKGKSKTLHRSSFVADVFETLLKGDIDKDEQDLLQQLEANLRKIKCGGDVQLSDEIMKVFRDLYELLQDCTNDEREPALIALAGDADYLPCHEVRAMFFALEHIPTFVIQGDKEVTCHIGKKEMDLMTSTGFQTAKILAADFFDTSRKYSYASDMFRIVFNLYYWPLVKIETDKTLSFRGAPWKRDSLSILPDHSRDLIRRENCLSMINTYIPARLLGKMGIQDKLPRKKEVKIFRDHYLRYLTDGGQGTFSVKVNEHGEPDEALILREEAFAALSLLELTR